MAPWTAASKKSSTPRITTFFKKTTVKNGMAIKPTTSTTLDVVCCTEPLPSLRYSVTNIICDGDAEKCRIPPHSSYFGGISEDEERSFCQKCFKKELHAKNVKFDDFQEMINENTASEDILKCIRCHDQWHRCCSFHIGSPESFVCKKHGNGRVKKIIGIKEFEKGSKHMEVRLNNFLKKRIGKKEALKTPIKVISFTAERAASTKELIGMVPQYYHEKLVAKFGTQIDYETRATYVFQRQEGVDQLFFVMFTETYWDHGKDGKSWFVIDYLDSVAHFQPAHLKTEVYQEVIHSYMDYMRRTGYFYGHLYANPPLQGDDYIFNVHPEWQKYPTKRRLQKWYHDMFKAGKEAGIIKSSRDFNAHGIKSAADLPVFVDGIWANLMKQEDTVDKEEFEEAMAYHFKKHGSDNFFIELEQPKGGVKNQDIYFYAHPILENRHLFLQECQRNNWEFGTRRRARFASAGVISLLKSYLVDDDCDMEC
ncbi:hypothetical protein B9Z55_004823 [Caenorhabditis nigoni]|uniref:histone acetyltransferase n=1 Tax=Caenorhabditis nigoni TaxID=1611254 RepID=A0A2G5UY64_9PELO|nr:hypothetical protein B9Z55_004823 [Caenorhabditis nigoni]